MALAWLRTETGVVGWAAALLALAGWMAFGGVPLLGLGLFAIAAVATVVWLPCLAVLLWMYWHGPAGRIREPRLAFGVVLGGLALYAILWLTVLPTAMGDFPEVVALYVPDALALLALAERAEAYGKPRLVEACLGALGAYTAVLPFFDDGRHLPWLAFTLSLAVLIALQALPMRTATRVAIGVGIIPVAWGLPAAVDDWELRIMGETLIVLAYAAGLVLMRRRLPKALAPPPSAPAVA